ncbi:MAG: hypothetical protein B7O98_05205 [Zestosphaera tikiterensis]|uniref:ASCH domain-containing protein n=1 Tax=Zestosphaera tikiterensis TaxID=1973259 RepID=A0A2R7Y5M0_9CREN|nr:MAG: hypothetical protein B7O98_05205 [Zestosphaera tikiterensis]
MKSRKTLAFKKEYGKPILLGRKTLTIRLNSNLKEGDVVEVRAGGVVLGKALIEEVKVKKVLELTDEDAVNDGFRSREELLRALKNIYKDRISASTEVKLIKFKLL